MEKNIFEIQQKEGNHKHVGAPSNLPIMPDVSVEEKSVTEDYKKILDVDAYPVPGTRRDPLFPSSPPNHSSTPRSGVASFFIGDSDNVYYSIHEKKINLKVGFEAIFSPSRLFFHIYPVLIRI